MYGGSYNGFTQWAAAKQLHPALKTIVPYVGSEKINGYQVDKDALINTQKSPISGWITFSNTHLVRLPQFSPSCLKPK